MRLLQLFHTSRRPLNLLGHQCLRVIDNSYSHPCLTSESCSPFRTVICHYQPPPRVLQLSTSTYIFSYSLTFWFHDTSMGHARLVCTHILFFLPRERFGSHSFPSPSDGSLLQFLSSLFLTMALSAKETLMYFGYTYAPNLTHQGASVITEKSSATLHTNG
jgi:hypothetical protein